MWVKENGQNKKQISLILVNFMNINTEHQGSAQGFSPLFKGEASPYLSPLFGSASQRHLSSQDDFTEFRLQELENQNNVIPQLPVASDQENQEILFPIFQVLEDVEPVKNQPEPEKAEIMTPAYVPRPNSSPIFSIVCFLVENDTLSESEALALGKQLYQNCEKYESIFRVLLGKFKKLRKTKEQMIKFCMRKAFKFSSDCRKMSKNSRAKKNFDKNVQKISPSLEMPFRKNSSQKTMNSQFLRQVFSNSEFLIDYEQFLENLEGIIEEDNSSKIQYLSDSIEKIVGKGNLEELDNIKRLPWTKTILKKTQNLAKSLIVDFGPGGQINESNEGQD